MSEHGLTLTPGSSPADLINLEEALLNASPKELGKLRFSFKLHDGRDVNNVVVRAAIKARVLRGFTMVTAIDNIRLEQVEAPSAASLWVEFGQIAGWSVTEIPTEPLPQSPPGA